MVTTLPRSPVRSRDAVLPGSWWFVTSLRGNLLDRSQCHVLIKCPLCSCVATLRDPMRYVSLTPDGPVFKAWDARLDGTRGHNIAPDGTVTPSIVCPNKACNGGNAWHVWGQLLDYTPEPAEAPVDCPVPPTPYTPFDHRPLTEL